MKKPSKLLIFFLISSSSLAQTGFQDLNQLQDIAQQFVDQELQRLNRSQTKAVVGKLDPRLQLVQCPSRPEGFIPRAMQQSLRTIGLRCNATPGWSIYLPVQLQTFSQALVSVKQLNAGDRIGPTDIELAVIESQAPQDGGFQNPDEINGAKVKRRVAAGQAFSRKDLCYVCQGDSVSIAAGSSSMQIVMPGQALSDGFLGQTIRVRNLSSRKEVMGRIETPDRVLVP